MTSENDPLEELLRIADAWHQERYRHATDLAILRDTCDREHKAGLDWCDEILRLKSERDELQDRLDASMPLPIDTDGVPCRIGDEMKGYGGRLMEVESLTLSEGGWKVRGKGGYMAEDPALFVHVAPKPETIEDVRRDVNDTVGIKGRDGKFHELSDEAKSISHDITLDLVRRAYECGMRDSCARGGYADPSVLGGDAS